MSNNRVSDMIKDVERAITKSSPWILTSVGIVGMITATVYTAAKATPKAMKCIEDVRATSDHELTKKEIIKAGYKPFIPVVVLTTTSVACIIGAQTVCGKRYAALYSAYKLSEAALTDHKNAVAEVVGLGAVKDIKNKIAEDKVTSCVGDDRTASDSITTTVVVGNDGKAWFLDPFTNEPFRSTVNEIDAAVNRLNKYLLDSTFVSLSELYDELDLQSSILSNKIGWCLDDGLIETSFSDAIIKNGRAYIVMDFLKRPEYGYDDPSKRYANYCR